MREILAFTCALAERNSSCELSLICGMLSCGHEEVVRKQEQSATAVSASRAQGTEEECSDLFLGGVAKSFFRSCVLSESASGLVNSSFPPPPA